MPFKTKEPKPNAATYAENTKFNNLPDLAALTIGWSWFLYLMVYQPSWVI